MPTSDTPRNARRRVAIPLLAVALLAGAVITGAVIAGAVSLGPRTRTPPASAPTLTIMTAASLSRPMRAALDSFAVRTGAHYDLEPGASLEIARRVTELHQRPDVIVLADPEVFPKLLMPRWVRWYALFARNRIVIAYTDRSRGADRIDARNWTSILTQRGVEVGRADPNTDPSGYRTLLVMQLAARHYRDPGLYARLLAAAPERNVRPREADQIALLQTHDLDYIWTYQSLAENFGLRSLELPHDVDLGDPADSAVYARVSTRVLGSHPGDTLTMRGAPILFAFSVPLTAPDRALAERFVAYLVSPEGKRILRAQHVDVLDRVIVTGSGAPSALGGG